MAEVNAANRERGTRQAGLQAEVAKLDRQIRTLLELIKDGHGGRGDGDGAAGGGAPPRGAAGDPAPKVPSFMSRACCPFAPVRGGLQRLLG